MIKRIGCFKAFLLFFTAILYSSAYAENKTKKEVVYTEFSKQQVVRLLESKYYNVIPTDIGDKRYLIFFSTIKAGKKHLYVLGYGRKFFSKKFTLMQYEAICNDGKNKNYEMDISCIDYKKWNDFNLSNFFKSSAGFFLNYDGNGVSIASSLNVYSSSGVSESNVLDFIEISLNDFSKVSESISGY
ncbi:hypothetical protein ACFQ02_08960 [Seminibacterium arietis]|uniref:Uncharacterized protein n=1 Tax=Seminibacterium arietis TaxID=1173502 RepID=A0ABW3IBX7_9PAST